MKKLFLLCLGAIASLNCMEERKEIRPMPPMVYDEDQEEHTYVVLKLLDEAGEVIDAIKVPDYFARQSTVIWDTIQNTKEEEDKEEPVVPLYAKSISKKKFKVLQDIAHETLLHNGSLDEALNSLMEQWGSQAPYKLRDLLIAADYIGNSELLHVISKRMTKSSVILQLLGQDGKVLDSMIIPDYVAEQSSTIRDITRFTEEEEGGELVVPLYAKTISQEQFKILQEFVNELQAHNGSLPESLTNLLNQWSRSHLLLVKFKDLMIVADHIGYEELANQAKRLLYLMIDRLKAQDKWHKIFALIATLPKGYYMQQLVHYMYPYIDLSDPDIIEIENAGFVDTLFANKEGQWLNASVKPEKTSEGKVTNNSIVSIFDLVSKKHIKSFRIEGKFYQKLVLSPSGNRIALESSIAGKIRVMVYDMKTEMRLMALSGVHCVNFVDDETLLLYSSDYISFVNINTKSNKKLNLTDRTMTPIYSVSVSPDKQYLAFKNVQDVVIFDMSKFDKDNTVDILFRIPYKSLRPIMLFSPDSHCLLYGSLNGDVVKFDLKKGHGVKIAAENADYNLSRMLFAFSPNSNLLAVARHSLTKSTVNGVIILSMLEHGVKEFIPVAYQSRIASIGFSPDGEKLAYSFAKRASESGKTVSVVPIIETWETFLFRRYYSAYAKEPALHDPILFSALFSEMPASFIEAFMELPKKIRKFFYYTSIELTGKQYFPSRQTFRSSQQQSIQYLPEKRKEPEKTTEEKTKKRKRPLKKFKIDEELQQDK